MKTAIFSQNAHEVMFKQINVYNITVIYHNDEQNKFLTVPR
jgi:hypothetical protein